MSVQSTPRAKLRLVVTGGIGAGKSTVTARFAERGAVVIEADAIGRSVLEPGGEAYRAVAERWPEVMDDGIVDRAALAEIVFTDVTLLRELEALTHPAIAAELRRRVAASRADVIVVELPIGVDLVGPGWLRIVVEAPDDLRLARSVERGFSRDDVRRRMQAQPPPGLWRTGADYVIVNDGTRDELASAADELWERLIRGR